MLQVAKESGNLREGRPEKTVSVRHRFPNESASTVPDDEPQGSDSTLRLSDLGISKKESAQAQVFASLPQTEFEALFDDSSLLTDAALLRKIRATKAGARPQKAEPQSFRSQSKSASTALTPPATPTPQAPKLELPALSYDTKSELYGDFEIFLKKLQKKVPGLSPSQLGALFYDWTSYRDRINARLTT
jgi:hypothetical protein